MQGSTWARTIARIGAAVLVALLHGCGGSGVDVLTMDASFRANVDVGGKPALLWLDTGAMGSDFYLDAAEHLGLTVGQGNGRSVTLVDSSGVECVLTRFAADVHYKLGPARCDVDYVACLPRADRPASPGVIDVSTRIDGHLGMDVMQHFVFWFGAPDKQLLVMTTDVIEGFVAERGYAVAQRIRLGGDANRPMARVRLEDDDEIELLLDTGADSTSLPAGLAGKLSLPSGAHLEEERREAQERAMRQQLEGQGLASVKVTVGQDDGSRVGVHGVATTPRPLFHLRSLRLGDREVPDLIVTEAAGSPVLGRDVLGRFNWILHGPRHELWLLDQK
jgi:hypothetical protein